MGLPRDGVRGKFIEQGVVDVGVVGVDVRLNSHEIVADAHAPGPERTTSKGDPVPFLRFRDRDGWLAGVRGGEDLVEQRLPGSVRRGCGAGFGGVAGGLDGFLPVVGAGDDVEDRRGGPWPIWTMPISTPKKPSSLSVCSLSQSRALRNSSRKLGATQMTVEASRPEA